ncbi:MAG: hypothetical protein ACON4U_09510 [Myxococcota bacterium]
MWLFSIVGCGEEIREAYEAEKATVLVSAEQPTDDGWGEDINLRIGYEQLNKLATTLIEDSLSGAKIEKSVLGQSLILRPNAEIRSLRLKDAPQKKAHVARFNLALGGELRWKTNSLNGTIPYSIELKGTLALPSDNQSIRVKINDVENIKVKLDGNLPLNITPLLKSWLKESLLNIPVMELYTLDNEIPILAMRVKTEATSINVELRSNVNHSTEMPQLTPLTTDWDICVSDKTLLGLIRREAFATGVVSNGVAVDPKSLQFNEDTFRLTVRLWKIEGFGGSWWRDYEAAGPIEYNDARGKIRLKATDVKEGKKSEGAGIADPIALLGEGFILSAIEENLTIALPQKSVFKIGDNRLIPTVKTIQSMPKYTQISGQIVLKEGLQKR